jgi:exosome complex component RRP45
VDLQLLNDDGNLIDAFFLAAVLALKNTRLPEVLMKGDSIFVSTDSLKQHFLNVHHIPVCTTFYFVPGISEPIVDAQSKEERLASARLSICVNVYEDICGMQTLGQMEVDPQQMVTSVRDSISIAKKTTALVRSAWEQRHSLPLL